MERFVKGDVVVLPFPFSDLSTSKKRPTLIVAKLKGDDLILCQITSQKRNDADAISLSIEDFKREGLSIDSWIRPTRLFTANSTIIKYKIGSIKESKVGEVANKLCEVFKR